VPTRSVLWFRRDLRLADNPALLAAADAGDEVVPLFVVDPALMGPAGAVRRAYLTRSLRSLGASLGDLLLLRHGDPVEHLTEVTRQLGASSVHVAADFGPYGRRRDDAVKRALNNVGVDLVCTGSPYAVAPGRVRKPDGSAYRVYTPFYRAWLTHGWRQPALSKQRAVAWTEPHGCHGYPDAAATPGLEVPPAGEAAAHETWRRFVDSGRLDRYGDDRNRPDLDATSRMSRHLRWGEVHPRTLLAEMARLGESKGHPIYRKELAWREFYADVLWHAPQTARENLRREFDVMTFDTGPSARERFAAWAQGRTGYPVVDAGMRQLLAEGWMHNRVRMIVASFLVKDLHLPWQRGAAHFMHNLVDGDLASNAHGWQWTAGTGTDAAPYFRVYNPVRQGQTFDPAGDYVRRYVPELRHVAGAAVHEPWALIDGLAHGYPDRIVDHAAERAEALDRFASIRT
jgi:deoxyribodipyrimidine photo-lyase